MTFSEESNKSIVFKVERPHHQRNPNGDTSQYRCFGVKDADDRVERYLMALEQCQECAARPPHAR